MFQQGQEGQGTWPLIASIIYTTAWCLSLYAQLYENYRLKSVQGFPLDYVVINVTGYTFYTIYSTAGYFTDVKGAGTVVIGDLVFVYNAILVIFLEVVQCFIYQRGKNMLHFAPIALIMVLWAIVGTTTVLYMTGVVDYYEYWNPITVLGYSKLVITFIKYTSPAYWNYKRKSTRGWSINSILTDLIGGVFSMASGGLSIQNGLNFTKVVLAFITVFYDLLFCFQHYCLYRKRPEANNSSGEELKLRQQQIS